MLGISECRQSGRATWRTSGLVREESRTRPACLFCQGFIGMCNSFLSRGLDTACVELSNASQGRRARAIAQQSEDERVPQCPSRMVHAALVGRDLHAAPSRISRVQQLPPACPLCLTASNECARAGGEHADLARRRQHSLKGEGGGPRAAYWITRQGASTAKLRAAAVQ